MSEIIWDLLCKPESERRKNQNFRDTSKQGYCSHHTEKELFQIDMSFNNISLKIKGSGHTVVDAITGELPCGQVTAIMGPSGAGKTSFLFTLSGKARTYGRISGDILINGEKGQTMNYSDVVGFVPQNDSVLCFTFVGVV